MSDHIARQALSRMNLREQALAEHYAGFANDMQMMAQADPVEAQQKFMDNTRMELCEAYGFGRPAQNKPFAFANGIAIIPIHGTLINRFGSTYGYVTGYNFIRAQHNQAMLDEDVTHIVHDHNSYGGEAAGCFELSDDIFASRGTKPIYAVVDSNCYSASYALASAADKIFVTSSSGVGSIGVVATHVDMSNMLDKFGIKITFISSGEHKVDGNPYEALSPDVKANIKKGVDKSRAAFVGLVSRNMGIDSKIVYDTEARTYRAEDALALGLVHAIAAPSTVLQLILNDEAGDDDTSDESDTENLSTTEPVMTTATPAVTQPTAAASPVVQPAAAASSTDLAAAKTAERARVSALVNCEEAKANPALANHIAFNTELSVEDGKAMMAASKPTAPAAAAKVEAANPFEAAMSKATHPKVGADGGLSAANEGGGEPTALSALLGDYEKASGHKLVEK